jgi:hypothetical protein
VKLHRYENSRSDADKCDAHMRVNGVWNRMNQYREIYKDCFDLVKEHQNELIRIRNNIKLFSPPYITDLILLVQQQREGNVPIVTLPHREVF